MRILFFTLIPIKNLQEKGIYADMISEFNDQGDNVDYYFPNKEKYFNLEQNVSFNSIRTRDNPQKQSNFIKKFFLYLDIEHNLSKIIKQNNNNYDLLIIVTPSIFQLKIIKSFKKKNPKAKVLLLLKDIFPDNAIDLGILKSAFPMNIAIKFFKSVENKLYGNVDLIGCMTPLNIKYISKKHPNIKEKLFLSPNSIKPYEIHQIETRKSLGLPEDKTIFIYTGNIGLPQDPNFINDFIYSLPENYFMVLIGTGSKFFFEPRTNLLIIKKQLKQNEIDQFLINSDYGLIFLSYKFNMPNYPSKKLSYENAQLPIISFTNLFSDFMEPNLEFSSNFNFESNLNGISNFLSVKFTNNPNRICRFSKIFNIDLNVKVIKDYAK